MRPTRFFAAATRAAAAAARATREATAPVMTVEHYDSTLRTFGLDRPVVVPTPPEGMAPPTEVQAAALKDNLLQAVTATLIHHEMERRRQRGGRVAYSISPEIAGPVLAPCKPDDPCFTHYRNMEFLLHRGVTPEDIIRGYMVSSEDPNGGRHKLNASLSHALLPTTPAIGTDYPKALGTAISLPLAAHLGIEDAPFSPDNICIVSGGNGGVHHPTALSTFNLARHFVERGNPVPLMFVVTDNGVAISERTLRPSHEELQHWGFPIFSADSRNPLQVLQQAEGCQTYVRTYKKPAVLTVKTKRQYGHSANKRDEVYTAEQQQKLATNHSLLYTMQQCVELGLLTEQDCRALYEETKHTIQTLADSVAEEPTLHPEEVARPIQPRPPKAKAPIPAPAPDRTFTLRQMLTRTFDALMAKDKSLVMFGQDIATGGHYGVTLGLKNRHPKQIFGFPIDEIGLGGIANGFTWNGLFPVVEFSYKAYFTEGGWQQYYEHFMQRFLSGGAPKKGFIFRMPALGLVVGGPTHAENAFPELLIPGCITFCPGTAYSAALCVRSAYELASGGNGVVFNEPTGQYMLKPEHYPEGCEALFCQPPDVQFEHGDVLVYRYQENHLDILSQEDLEGAHQPTLVITYGNGIKMTLEAISKLPDSQQSRVLVVEVPNLKASDQLLAVTKGAERILIADECRQSAAPGNAMFVDIGQQQKPEQLRLITSADTFNPSGPAGRANYLSADQIGEVLGEMLEEVPTSHLTFS